LAVAYFFGFKKNVSFLMGYKKIINDPVHGFISINDAVVAKLIAHPFFQRLRRINQNALAQLVYPGAVHTRFHHALGAYHLMGLALDELKKKGVVITQQEEQGAQLAILLHDIGHGPFSHALEEVLVTGVHHEQLSWLIMQELNKEMNGALDTATAIFAGTYPKKFLSQLLSGQLDVDRMDYLTRDSFFTGVSEGAIGYDRILKMLVVQDGQLMVEEKGIFSIEKFLVSRRLMYWQVYLHKTVLVAEKMMVNILKRARAIKALAPTPFLQFFLDSNIEQAQAGNHLFEFCQLDDTDILCAIKQWQMHEDKVLQTLCKMLLNRKLLKIKLQSEAFDAALIDEYREKARQQLQLSDTEIDYFVFHGSATNTMYNAEDEKINILFKDGSIKDISAVDNALIQQSLASKVRKNYLCYPG
jgi:uncharacterized protein